MRARGNDQLWGARAASPHVSAACRDVLKTMLHTGARHAIECCRQAVGNDGLAARAPQT